MVVVLTWTILPDKVCSWFHLPQFLVGVAAGLSRVQDLELREDQGNNYSTEIGVKGDSSDFFFSPVFSILSQSCTFTVSVVSTDIARGYS